MEIPLKSAAVLASLSHKYKITIPDLKERWPYVTMAREETS